ncbi:MAG TPA: hypothetical protein PKW80_13595 [Bacteroidales bacterium]|nr:hypothetical protein [Bacteroidales bacterium]
MRNPLIPIFSLSLIIIIQLVLTAVTQKQNGPKYTVTETVIEGCFCHFMPSVFYATSEGYLILRT